MPYDLKTLEGDIKIIQEIVRIILQLIREFDQAKASEQTPSSVVKSAIVVQRAAELRENYRQLLLKYEDLKETPTEALHEEMDQITSECMEIYNANKEIIYLEVQLQKIWNVAGSSITRNKVLRELYRRILGILSKLENEERSRKGEPTEIFDNLFLLSEQYLEYIGKVWNALESGDTEINQYIVEIGEIIFSTSEDERSYGNCMYNAVIAALEDITGGARVATTLLGGNAEERMRYLRRVVAERVRAMYNNGVDENNAVVLNNAIATARRHPGFIDDTTDQEAVDFYIDTIIATPGPHNWGDHTVLQIIADVLQIIIRVHQEENGAVITITPMQEAVEDDYPMIQLLHQGEVHYEVHRENGYDNMPALVANEINDEIATYADVHVGNNTHVPQEAEDDLSCVIGGNLLQSSTH